MDEPWPAAGLEPETDLDCSHVLFVDDEVSIVGMSSKILESMGFQVTAFTSSPEALAAFRADPARYDVVITDQTMPNLTGVELAQEILKVCPQLPIILCTGFSETASREEATALGISEYMTKPIARDCLAQALERVLGKLVVS
jgi:CheY-like chemotaxis protein